MTKEELEEIRDFENILQCIRDGFVGESSERRQQMKRAFRALLFFFEI